VSLFPRCGGLLWKVGRGVRRYCYDTVIRFSRPFQVLRPVHKATTFAIFWFKFYVKLIDKNTTFYQISAHLFSHLLEFLIFFSSSIPTLRAPTFKRVPHRHWFGNSLSRFVLYLPVRQMDLLINWLKEVIRYGNNIDRKPRGRIDDRLSIINSFKWH